MSKWKTIDSAPKDGLHLLLVGNDEGVFVGIWVDGDWYKDGCDFAVDHVTHWQPLPALPVYA